MDDLERKKKFGCEGKILSIFKKKSYARYPSKNIFAYSTISEHSKHFFYILKEKKTLLEDASANYVSFLRVP